MVLTDWENKRITHHSITLTIIVINWQDSFRFSSPFQNLGLIVRYTHPALLRRISVFTLSVVFITISVPMMSHDVAAHCPSAHFRGLNILPANHFSFLETASQVPKACFQSHFLRTSHRSFYWVTFKFTVSSIISILPLGLWWIFFWNFRYYVFHF